MADLYVAIAAMVLASLLAFALGLRLARSVAPRIAGVLAAMTCALIVCLALFLRDHLLLTRLVPFSAVVIYGNLVPPAGSFLAGIAYRRIPGRAWRRTLSLGGLLLLCLYQSYGFLFDAPPPLDHRWKGDVCRQTSPASCSPAAAATLLRAHGIATTEAEMAELCLTRPGGTSMHGLYRGLRIKTAGSGRRVEAFRGNIDILRTQPGPVILAVKLRPGPGVDPRYEQLWGWTPGVAHTVVFYGFRAGGKAEIGDPAVGLEHWRLLDLDVLWQGDGLRLVPR